MKSDRRLMDAELSFRDGGEVPKTTSSSGGLEAHEEVPICFVRVIHFPGDWFRTKTGEQRRNELNSEIECDEFTPWQQGLTPKEHLEMNILERQRAWQVELENAQIDYQRERDASIERQAKDQREFQAEQAEKSRKYGNRSLAIAVAAVVATIIGSLVGAAAQLMAASKAQTAPPPATINVVYPESKPLPVLPQLVDELKGLLPAER